MDALAEVEVDIDDVRQSGFKLTFSVDKQSPLQILFLLTGGSTPIFLRVVIVAVVNGISNVLIDGFVTDTSMAPGDKGSNSTLTLMGKDLTVAMDQSKWTGFPFPALPAEARVGLILLKYAVFGIIRWLFQHIAVRSASYRPDTQPEGYGFAVHPLPSGASWICFLY